MKIVLGPDAQHEKEKADLCVKMIKCATLHWGEVLWVVYVLAG